MKRIILLIVTSVFCLMAHAEWIEAAESDEFTVYVNTDITQEYSGHYIVWNKWVIKAKALKQVRNRLYRQMKNSKYLKCSYYVEMAKYDLNNNRSKSYSLTWYNASGSVIDTSNIEYYSEWTYPMPDSMSEGIMYMVKMLIAMQESD